MDQMTEEYTFLIVENLFRRYTIITSSDGPASVYCDACGEWVAEYDDTENWGELDLYETIIRSHNGETYLPGRDDRWQQA